MGAPFVGNAAEDSSGDPVTDAFLPPVVVVAESRPDYPATTITQSQLEDLPLRNNSLNEALRLLPGVVSSDFSNLSTRGGEIEPALLSISGGAFYQNNVVIDGTSANLLLDPANATNSSATAYDKPDKVWDLPSRPQSLLLQADLVGKVSILDRNVSARYGSFSGGVVEIATRDPRDIFGGTLSLGSTRDAWTSFHVADPDAFVQSDSRDEQPRFEKINRGLTLDIPLNPYGGMLFGYSRLDSTIPLVVYDEPARERRTLENYLVKIVQSPDPDNRIELSLTRTPSHGDYVRSNAHNSNYRIDVDAMTLAVDYRQKLSAGNLHLHAAAGQSVSDRQAPDLWKIWANNYNEGGYGDLRQEQQSRSVSADYETAEIKTGSALQLLRFGGVIESIRGRFVRPETNYVYWSPKLFGSGNPPWDGSCAGDDVACIANQQYLSTRFVYRAVDVEASLNRQSLYLEDEIRWKRLTVRPGVRLSRDSYMGNQDLAPRLMIRYNLVADESAALLFGGNRYYSETLLAVKLKEGILPLLTETRTSPAASWGNPKTSLTLNRFSDLKTPYTDEASVGFEKRFGTVQTGLDYLQRRGYDQFAATSYKDETGVKISTYTNDGRSGYESVRFWLAAPGEPQDVSFNLTWQQRWTTADTYLVSLDETALSQVVYYHGEYLNKGDLPRDSDDFNPEWSANLVWSLRLPHNLSFTNVTTWRSRYQVIGATGARVPAAPDSTATVAVYDEQTVHSAFLFDWLLRWSRPLPRRMQLDLTASVYNVFNHKVPVGTSPETWQAGRQFWLDGVYRF